MGQLQLLYELQQVELLLEKLQTKLKQLPVFAEFKQLKSVTAEAKESAGWAEIKLQEHKNRVQRLEADLQHTEDEYQAVQTLLYSDTGQGAKELEQLEKKAASLLQERTAQEEALLLAMEGTDDMENAWQAAKEKLRSKTQKLKQLQTTGNEEIEQLKQEILHYREKKELLLSRISAAFLTEYQQNRARYHGRPLALADGGICGGCRVSLPTQLQSLLHKPDVKIQCENCGRILVVIKS